MSFGPGGGPLRAVRLHRPDRTLLAETAGWPPMNQSRTAAAMVGPTPSGARGRRGRGHPASGRCASHSSAAVASEPWASTTGVPSPQASTWRSVLGYVPGVVSIVMTWSSFVAAVGCRVVVSTLTAPNCRCGRGQRRPWHEPRARLRKACRARVSKSPRCSPWPSSTTTTLRSPRSGNQESWKDPALQSVEVPNGGSYFQSSQSVILC